MLTLVTEFAETDSRGSDHDPVVSRLTFGDSSGEEIIGIDGRDNLTGTAGDDIILGLGARDRIDGGAGNDIIVGGGGNDVLTGGGDIDTFVYEDLSDRSDRITDFEVGIDLIDLSAIFAQPEFGSATPLEDYVQIVGQGSDTVVLIDLNGDSGFTDRFRRLTVLQGVEAADVTADSFIV